MKIIQYFRVISICTFFASAAWAADIDDHKAHHSEVSGASGGAKKAGVNISAKSDSTTHSSKAQDIMEKMDNQIQMMDEMHEKMMNAKTPDERRSLMAEHLKAMQGGMTMMHDFSKSYSMSMNDNSPGNMMKSDTKGRMQDGMNEDMEMHHRMMEKRMQMMETMMQMMMDRMTP